MRFLKCLRALTLNDTPSTLFRVESGSDFHFKQSTYIN
jgi:hypothetical protein